MPEFLLPLIVQFPPWLRGWVTLAIMAILGSVAHALLFVALRVGLRVVPRLAPVKRLFLARVRAPSRLLFPLVAMRLALGAGATGDFFTPASARVLGVVLDGSIILAATWLLVRITFVFEEIVFERATIEAEDNLEARRIRTRVTLLRQMLTVLVVLIGAALLLMLHPAFRLLGTGILASAGVAGIVIGIAAQGPVRNLLAGFQIAMTQPIRVDDVVIVEGEWGQIEEITLTYVVVRIWDLRRLVIPIGYFIDKPFQNWTRSSASILGTAFLYVDYTAPIEGIRAKLREIAEASELWDRKVCVLHLTELKEQTIELRALVSAASAGRAFDLRAEVREKLITWLRESHPYALPRVRAELAAEEGRGGPDARGAGEGPRAEGAAGAPPAAPGR